MAICTHTQRVETSLFKAVYAAEFGLSNINDVPVGIDRPSGVSRGSSCAQRNNHLVYTI